MYNMYVDNGVIIKPNVIAKGDYATVVYNGILYDSGADSVYMHAGFGNSWESAKDIKMNRTTDGFVGELPITSSDNLNIAFKDSANNWDNNSSQNYSFEVQDH